MQWKWLLCFGKNFRKAMAAPFASGTEIPCWSPARTSIQTHGKPLDLLPERSSCFSTSGTGSDLPFFFGWVEKCIFSWYKGNDPYQQFEQLWTASGGLSDHTPMKIAYHCKVSIEINFKVSGYPERHVAVAVPAARWIAPSTPPPPKSEQLTMLLRQMFQ